MKDISLKAQVYILTVLLVGVGLLLWSLSNFELKDLWMTLILSALGSLSLLFKVTGSTERSHYNISFTIYAFSLLLLGAPETIAIILISHLVDWAWHKYPWYIQSFNIGQYILVAYATSAVFNSINPNHALFTTLGVLSVLISILVFTFLNHFFIGLVVWLARGENFFESGVFDPFALMLDFTLLIIGAGAAMLWALNPLAVVIMVIPLYLVYNTLRVPALERKSETDPKTGLYNAHFFSQALEYELKKPYKKSKKLTIVMADLDLLREINNTYGHLGGDEVLVGVANILKENLRREDIVARFGGEEYAILFTGMQEGEVFERIEGIRKKVAAAEFLVPSRMTPIKATMSFGIASRNRGDQFANDIIHNADLALYHAKLSGRNRTCVYSDENSEAFFAKILENHLESGIPEDSTLEKRSNSLSTLSAFSTKASIERPEDMEDDLGERSGDRTDQGSRRSPRLVNAYVAGLTILALGACLTQIGYEFEIDWLGLALFASLVMVAEWFSVDLYQRETAVSTSAAPMLAGILLFGPVSALALSFSFALASFIKHRSPLNRFVFNFSNQLFAAMIYTTLIDQTGYMFLDWNTLAQFAICMVAAMLVYFVTTLAISVAVRMDQGLPLKQFWLDQYSWLAPMYLSIGLIAFALILIYLIAGLPGLAIILAPMFILRLSQKQYLERTRDTAIKLNESNMRLAFQKRKVSRLNEELLQALSQVIDIRDPYVLGHSHHVVEYAVRIAQKMKLSPQRVECIRKAGMLHDIGKCGIRDSILYKPGRLNPYEYEIIKQHTVIGAEIIAKVGDLKDLVPIIRHHHERIDGNGYPDGLAGEEIPLEARIMALADAIEAMASDRLYKKALTPDEILDEVERCKGTQFDPKVVNAFFAIVQQEGLSIIQNSTVEQKDGFAINWWIPEDRQVERKPT